MSELPLGWEIVSPLDVALPIRGVTYKKEQAIGEARRGYTAVLRANNIQNDRISLTDLVYVPNENVQTHQRLRVHDIVIAMSSGSISVVGKSAQVKQPLEASFGAFCGALRPCEEIEPRYIGHFLKSDAYRSAISDMARGVNINNLKWSHFEKIGLPLAPVAEQKRISEKLDTLLARVDATRDRLDRIPELLKRFRQSVLAAATSGQLTEDWRQEQQSKASAQPIAPVHHGSDSDLTPPKGQVDLMPAGWLQTTIGAVSISIRYGTSKKCSYSDAGIGVLRIPNITDHGRIDKNDLKRANFDKNEVEKLALQVGDLLVIRSNGSIDLVGRAGIVSAQEVGLIFAGYLMRLRGDKSKVMPEYLHIALSEPEQRVRIGLTSKSTSGVNNLNAEELRLLPIWLPELDEQREIVRRVVSLFTLADKIEARYTSVRAQVNKLTPALLAKAFRGELVPQDSNDEPAEKLLTRLRATRDAIPTSAWRGRKKS